MLDRRVLTDAEVPEHLRQYKPHLLGPEKQDLRDIPARAIDPAMSERLPSSCQLPRITPVRDQQMIGSCTGFGVTAMLENMLYRRSGMDHAVQLSPEYAYYVGRLMDGTQAHDAGSYVRSVLKGISKFGVPPEEFWPYNGFDNQTYLQTIPDPFAQFEASFVKTFTYVRLNSLDDMRSSIAQGFGFAACFLEFENLFSSEVQMSGDLKMPTPDEGIRGGHCTFFCGYDDATQRFTFKNSWSTRFGNSGYGTIPYGYLTFKNGMIDENTSYATDAWSVRLR